MVLYLESEQPGLLMGVGDEIEYSASGVRGRRT